MHKIFGIGMLLVILLSLLGSGIHSAALFSAPHDAHAQGSSIPLPTAGPGEHPRLLITQSYVDNTLKTRFAQGQYTWTAFSIYISSTDPEEDAQWTPGTALKSLAVAWLVTADDSYMQRARDIMIDLVNRVESDPVMLGSGGLDGSFMENVASLAIGYDWLYNAMNEEDRSALRGVLWRAAQVMRDPANDTSGIIWLDGQLMAFGNYEPRWLWALTAVALAISPEMPDALELASFCRDTLVNTFIPALDLQERGAWSEGPVYGFLSNWPKVQTALVWWTAAGEDYFDDTRWWYDRLAYDLFLYYPSQARTYNQTWGDPIHNYPSIIGDSERYHPVVVYGRAQDLLLRTVYEGTEHGDWMDWFLDQPPDGMPPWMTVEEFLWRDPTRTGTPPPSLTWYTPYNGHVFMRSNWSTEDGRLDETATYVSFNAGDRLSYHQFYDQGSFTIFHNGADLVVRSGVYSGNGTSDQDVNYYVRAIAGNTILVCDLAENFDGIRPNGERDVWLNDCGQRTMSPASRTAINRDYLVENWQIYDTGSVTRFSEEGDLTYLRADITGAYNSTFYTTPENRAKVDQVIRELIYWRPGTVIVYDRVVTTAPSFTPMTVFHFQNEPTASGLFFGTLVGNSAIYMQNMLPNSRVSMVPGYQVAGQTVDQSWGEPASNDFETSLYGPYRLEITPSAAQLDNWFLSTFIAQDSSAPPPAEGILALGEGMRGVIRGDVQVMFDLTPGDVTNVTEATFQIGPGVQYTLLTGLEPSETYLIQGEGSFSQTMTASDAGLILLASVQPGGMRIQAQ